MSHKKHDAEVEDMVESFLEYYDDKDIKLCHAVIAQLREYSEYKLADHLEAKLFDSDFYQSADYEDRDLENRISEALGK